MKTLCVFHSPCLDGFTAAWVVRCALGAENVEFFPGVYQNPPPDVRGRDVVLVDFSYKRATVEAIIAAAASVTVLDHHVSAIEDLRGLTGLHAVFDVNRSGARIAWDYYFPDQDAPTLLRHVEDRDLWRFLLPRTRDVNAALFSYPYDFATWDTLMAADPLTLAAEGVAIDRKLRKDVNELLTVVTRDMVIGGHRVRVANLPYTLTSEAGHALADGAPFGGCYWDTPEGRVFSLRSTDAGLDVSVIAQQYGGGGHRNAAGFRVSFAAAAAFEVPQ